MTVTEQYKLIGKRALLPITAYRGVTIAVDILNLRQRYGQLDALVRPIAGEGQTWVTLSSLAVVDAENR